MRWQLMAAFMAVTLAVVIVQDLPLGSYLMRTERERITTALERDAFVLAGRSEEALEAGVPDPALVTDAQRYHRSSGARVVIVDTSGTAVATSDDDQATAGSSYRSRPEIGTALSGQITTGQRRSDSLGTDLLYVTVPVLSGEQVVGAVRLTYPAHVVTDQVRGQLRALWLVAAVTVILAGIVAFLIAGTVTRRLQQLRRTTEHLAEGHLGARTPESAGAPEIRSLARSFNRMADRLEYLLRQQRAFAGDASHQLRTPLTALRLRLDGAADLIDADPEAARRTLASAQDEVLRLQQLVDALLVLSRADDSGAAPQQTDLAEVARARVEQWEPLADESGTRITVTAPAAALVLAVPGAAEQIIDNLLDNALTVSSPGSTVEVTVDKATGDAVDLHVLDHGPGLSAEDRIRAFDRFWRARTDTEGSGLGLAIVAQLARASGATAELLPRHPNGGLDAHVRFRAVAPR
ncbi:sensor histidine kinase [Rhodococcus zopfii]|uniref:sensor histidine kinase n=1 Tax=Rhodococcus zopfii TaxID=43772 RepID=UPI001F0D130E|nr:ATP-binding protein [Rhodococcus zopfii]